MCLVEQHKQKLRGRKELTRWEEEGVYDRYQLGNLLETKLIKS